MCECLKETMDDAVQIFNFIKTRPKHSLFCILYDEMSSEHKQLPHHCEVRWLLKGKALSRFFELCDKLKMFLLERNCDDKSISYFNEYGCDETWLKRFAYLSDIFSTLNVMNLTL